MRLSKNASKQPAVAGAHLPHHLHPPNHCQGGHPVLLLGEVLAGGDHHLNHGVPLDQDIHAAQLPVQVAEVPGDGLLLATCWVGWTTGGEFILSTNNNNKWWPIYAFLSRVLFIP